MSPARHQLFTWALDALAPLADLPRGRPAAEAAELLLRLWERSCAELPPRALLLGAAKKPSASRSYGYRAASAWPVPKPGCADVERLGWAWSELRRRVGLDLSAGREFGGCWSVAQLARVLAATQALAARARPSPALLGLDLAAPCPLGMWGAGPGGAADRILEVVAAWSAFAVGVWAKLRGGLVTRLAALGAKAAKARGSSAEQAAALEAGAAAMGAMLREVAAAELAHVRDAEALCGELGVAWRRIRAGDKLESNGTLGGCQAGTVVEVLRRQDQGDARASPPQNRTGGYGYGLSTTSVSDTASGWIVRYKSYRSTAEHTMCTLALLQRCCLGPASKQPRFFAEPDLAACLRADAAALSRATRPGGDGCPEELKDMLEFGAGPRAGQFLVRGAKAFAAMEGRSFTNCADIKKCCIPVLRHRISPSFKAQAAGVNTEMIIAKLLELIPEPEVPKFV